MDKIPEKPQPEFEALIDARAYRLFGLRGQRPGYALDDWLEAEGDVHRQFDSIQTLHDELWDVLYGRGRIECTCECRRKLKFESVISFVVQIMLHHGGADFFEMARGCLDTFIPPETRTRTGKSDRKHRTR